MDIDSITSAQAAYEARQKEEKEKQRIQRERDFDKSVSLATLERLQKQNDLISTQNKQLKEDSITTKKDNKKVLIISIITACLAFATLVVTIILHFVK